MESLLRRRQDGGGTRPNAVLDDELSHGARDVAGATLSNLSIAIRSTRSRFSTARRVYTRYTVCPPVGHGPAVILVDDDAPRQVGARTNLDGARRCRMPHAQRAAYGAARGGKKLSSEWLLEWRHPTSVLDAQPSFLRARNTVSSRTHSHSFVFALFRCSVRPSVRLLLRRGERVDKQRVSARANGRKINGGGGARSLAHSRYCSYLFIHRYI